MSDTWWAAVRYTDGEGENVSVQKIKNFQPTHLTDYEQGYKYTVRTSAWNNERREEKYKAYIVRLAETLPALVESLRRKRAHCPPLGVRESDGPITTTQDEDEVLDPTEIQRDKEVLDNYELLLPVTDQFLSYVQNDLETDGQWKRKRQHRKRAADSMLTDIINQAKCNQKFLNSSQSAGAVPRDDAQPSASHSGQENQDKDAVIEQLKKKIRTLENSLMNKTEDPVIAKLHEMEEKFKDIAYLTEKMTKIEKYLSEYKPHYRYQYVTQWLESQGDVSVTTNSELYS